MILVFPTIEEVAQHVSNILTQSIKTNPKINLGLATGGTMEPVYELLIQQVKEQNIDVSQLSSFNLDEYVGLNQEHHQSYAWYMQQKLFQHLPFNLNNCLVPNGKVENIEKYCKNYSESINSAGGIDLQLLGVGSNGHIGFNEPGTPFDSCCHLVKLSEQTRTDNSRFFAAGELVPDSAITMGLADIMAAREIVLVATGEQKADTMRLFVENDVTEDVPFTILKQHKNIQIVLDEMAASKLKNI